ncbi:uncharacterized protein ACRADG_007611 isoform 2-T2 [Cochliomyia hominivorax]
MSKILQIILIILIQIVLKVKQIVTLVDRVETFPNGCYMQRVIQPDLSNTKRFYESQLLICPPSVNISSINTGTTYPKLPLNFTHANVYQPQYPMVPVNNISLYNHTYGQHFPHPAVSAQPVVPPNPYAPSAPLYNPSNMPPAVIPSPSVPSSPGSISPAGVITSNMNSHIILLSNRTGFYDKIKGKNSANSLCYINGIFVFLFIVLFCNIN